MKRTLSHEWILPAPEKGPDREWHPVVRIGRVIPFGYCQDPNDCDIINPIPEQLELLEEAKKHLKKYSYRNVANWLSEQSGRYISHVGLMKRIKIEHKRKAQATVSRNLAQRYKEAIEKAERLEASRIGGSRTSSVPDPVADTDTDPS